MPSLFAIGPSSPTSSEVSIPSFLLNQDPTTPKARPSKKSLRMPRPATRSRKPKKQPSFRVPPNIPEASIQQQNNKTVPQGQSKKTRTIASKKTLIRIARRRRVGAKALQEIRRYQRTTDLCIPRLPFRRLIRELMHDISPGLRVQGNALGALQEAAEAYLTCEFELSLLAALHAKRVTLQQKDMKLVQSMRKKGLAL